MSRLFFSQTLDVGGRICLFFCGKRVWRLEDSFRLKEIMISSEETNLGQMVWAYGLYHIVYAPVAACRKAGVPLE